MSAGVGTALGHLLTAGQRRNGTRKIGRAAGRSADAGYGAWRDDPNMTIPDLPRLGDPGLGDPVHDDPDAGAGSRQPGRGTGRHAAPKRPFLRRKAARFRAGKAVPAAAMAATLAVGAAAYGVTTSVRHSSGLSAELATVPSGGYTLAAGGALAAIGPSKRQTAGSGATQSGGIYTALAAGVAQSQRVLAGVAKSTPVSHPPAHPAATSSRARASSPTAAPSAPAAPATTPTAASSPAATTAPGSGSQGKTTLSCSTSDGMLPDNVTAIVSFLLAHGYSDNAAAGIAGNIYQESKGNPESEGDGGGGLIGWTPLPAGYVTGNPASDLQTQLAALLTFNEQWSQYLPELNDAGTPADAAGIYVTDFERAGIPAAGTREASAQDVASACGI